MALRLIYRSYGGENMKSRPEYYSKLLALASFLHAAEVADAEVTFLNDGPIPGDRLAMMQGRGEVVELPDGPVGMRRSYLAGLRLPGQRNWDETDVAYFSEDDYLHSPEAFVQLREVAAVSILPSYFALYGSTPAHRTHDQDESETAPRLPAQPISANGQDWINIPSTASTFGARVGALIEDISIFQQCMWPYRRSYLDHETCLVYQGRVPYGIPQILLGLKERRRPGPVAQTKNLVLIPFRLGINVRAVTRRQRPHLLYAADPNLACHLELAFMSPGRDWLDVARRTAEWAAQGGHPVSLHGV